VRILIVTPWFPTAEHPESGIFVAREAAALAERHNVHVLHMDWNHADATPLPVDGARVTRRAFRRHRPSDLLRARRVVRRVARDADVVHTHALPGLLPWLIGRPAPAPWVHSEHFSGLTAPETLRGPERALTRMLRRVLRRPALVVAESERLASAVRSARSGPVAVVPCVVPSAAVADRPREAGVLRLVGVGGLIPRKGPDVAVEAVAELRQRGVDARLVWVGGGPLFERLDDMVRARGLEDAVTFTGPLPTEGVEAALDGADLFILPTLGDNFCVVVAEALSHGRPVVTGSQTGAVDYAPAEASIFVSTHEPVAYADAVIELARRTAHLTAAAIAGMVRGRFSPEHVRMLLEAGYERAAGGGVSASIRGES